MSLGLTRQRPGELPLEVTGFVGRHRELAELTGLLRTARLVTVTGPGGVGKTRVALRAAAQFAQCAAAAVPGFEVTDANRDCVIRLCRRLDGVPLAIELATRRLRAIPLEQLADRLEDRFRLLAGGRRAALPHHQTIRAATEWSYDLCSPAEQLLWARLSAFAGSFDVAAAEQICADERLDARDVLATLIGLVDKSVLLRADGDGTRYLLLDTIREFGAEKLDERGEQDMIRQQHLARYC